MSTINTICEISSVIVSPAFISAATVLTIAAATTLGLMTRK
jgi:hypothetical protein